MVGPDPNDKYPIQGNRNVQFIKNTITNPNIVAGEYSYYDAKNGELFEEQVLYHYEAIGTKLVIGKFCSIAAETTFIMGGANHRMDGSTYPFSIFGHGWEAYMPTLEQLSIKGDTVVVKDVQPYTIVGGNPAKEIRQRYPSEVIDELLNIRWWDADTELINRYIGAIVSGDLEKLREMEAYIRRN